MEQIESIDLKPEGQEMVTLGLGHLKFVFRV